VPGEPCPPNKGADWESFYTIMGLCIGFAILFGLSLIVIGVMWHRMRQQSSGHASLKEGLVGR